MGERAQRGYEEAERQAFRELPRAQRIKATLTAVFFTGAVAAALFLIFVYPSLAGQQIVGVASVIDGDTIEIHGERIRFNGDPHAALAAALDDIAYLQRELSLASLTMSYGFARGWHLSIADSDG